MQKQLLHIRTVEPSRYHHDITPVNGLCRAYVHANMSMVMPYPKEPLSPKFHFSRHTAGEAELGAAVEYIGRPVEHVVVTVDCPQAIVSPSITAEVAGDHLYINMPGCKQLDIHLHFAVSAENATAQLMKDNKQLCIKLPYMPCRTYLDQVKICIWLYVSLLRHNYRVLCCTFQLCCLMHYHEMQLDQS